MARWKCCQVAAVPKPEGNIDLKPRRSCVVFEACEKARLGLFRSTVNLHGHAAVGVVLLTYRCVGESDWRVVARLLLRTWASTVHVLSPCY